MHKVLAGKEARGYKSDARAERKSIIARPADGKKGHQGSGTLHDTAQVHKCTIPADTALRSHSGAVLMHSLVWCGHYAA